MEKSFKERVEGIGGKGLTWLEDYFDGKDEVLSIFWHAVNKRLSEAA